MIQFASYIDRQKSGPGSSEKSQKVHSANWKEEIQLKKEMDCLNKQEQQRVAKISSDQRLVVHRFQRKLSLSVDIAKKHDEVKESLDSNHKRARELRKLQNENNDTNGEERMSLRQLRCLSASPKPPLPKFRRAKSCEPPRLDSAALYGEEPQCFTEKPDLPPRPMTALEKRNKMWERQLKTVTQRLNRARSAPARTSYYKVPEFSVMQRNNSRDSKNAGQKQRRHTSLEIDLEYFRRVREKELYLQRQAVKNFIISIEPLELVQWTPGHEPTENNNERELDSVVMTAVMLNKQDVVNGNRSKTRSVGSYNTKDVSIVATKRGNGEERSTNMINKKKLFNAWS